MQTEGELRLTVRLNRVPVYRMIFIIAKGRLFDNSAENIIFITCVQGLVNSLTIRQATEQCEHVHPSDLLMTALSGVAQACEIDTILGIKTIQQIANYGAVYFSYEEFFIQYGARNATDSLCEMKIPFPHREIINVAAKHRNRTRKKRAFREQISTSSMETMLIYRIGSSQR